MHSSSGGFIFYFVLPHGPGTLETYVGSGQRKGEACCQQGVRWSLQGAMTQAPGRMAWAVLLNGTEHECHHKLPSRGVMEIRRRVRSSTSHNTPLQHFSLFLRNKSHCFSLVTVGCRPRHHDGMIKVGSVLHRNTMSLRTPSGWKCKIIEILPRNSVEDLGRPQTAS